MFLHGTDENIAFMGQQVLTWKTILQNGIKTSCWLIRFWQSNALVVQLLFTLFAVQSATKNNVLDVVAATVKIAKHISITHLGRSPQRAQLCDLTGNEGETRQIRELPVHSLVSVVHRNIPSGYFN